MHTLCRSIATALTLVIGAASMPAHADPEGWEGVSCTVNGGANQGKSGIVTVEKGDDGSTNVYCEGSWGATECGGSPNKCVSTSVVPGAGGVRRIGNPIVSVPSTLIPSTAQRAAP